MTQTTGDRIVGTVVGSGTRQGHCASFKRSRRAGPLRAVGGLTTAQIAAAFLVPEATMAQRISRAKQTIDASELPLERPETRPRTSALIDVAPFRLLGFAINAASTGRAVDDYGMHCFR